jgi:hypothetical protein
MGGKTAQTTQSVTIPPEVLARYTAINKRAEGVANTPFQPYSQDQSSFVQPLTGTQTAAMQNIGQAQNIAQPYYQAAAGLTGMAAQQTPGLINQYMSPYLNSVVGTTMDQLRQQQQQEQQGLSSSAIQSGAFGGDRAGIASANLSRQQNMASASTVANLMNQGYGQAAALAQADLQRQMAAGQQFANLGTGATQTALGAAQAQLGAGTLEQQTGQAGLAALYNQFLQERGYPFQTTQFLSNIATGTGAASGSTTTGTQPVQGLFSDERLKSNIEEVGQLHDGQPIYRYNMGDGPTQIGLIAQNVEQNTPDAVGQSNGFKTVNYHKATDRSAGLVPQSMGGAVHQDVSGEGFNRGGYASGGSGLDQNDIRELLAQQIKFLGPFAQGGLYGGSPQGQPMGGASGWVPPPSLHVPGLITPAKLPDPIKSPINSFLQDEFKQASKDPKAYKEKLANYKQISQDLYNRVSGKTPTKDTTTEILPADKTAELSSFNPENTTELASLEVPELPDDLLSGSLFSARGGVVPSHYASGGSPNTGSAASLLDPTKGWPSYLPEDLFAKQGEDAKLEPASLPKSAQGSGPGIGDLVKIATMFLAKGGAAGNGYARGGYATGGAPITYNIVDKTNMDDVLPQTKSYLEALSGPAAAAGLASLNVNAGAGSGHLSHQAGTELDIIGRNPNGSLWTDEQKAALGAAWAEIVGPQNARLGLYEGGSSIHVGYATPQNNLPAAFWGAKGLTEGSASRNYTVGPFAALFRDVSTSQVAARGFGPNGAPTPPALIPNPPSAGLVPGKPSLITAPPGNQFVSQNLAYKPPGDQTKYYSQPTYTAQTTSNIPAAPYAQMLADRGYGTGKDAVANFQNIMGLSQDGIIGPQTAAAIQMQQLGFSGIRDFQEKNNIAVDGIIGPQTLGALQNYQSNQAASSSQQPASVPDVVPNQGQLGFDAYKQWVDTNPTEGTSPSPPWSPQSQPVATQQYGGPGFNATSTGWADPTNLPSAGGAAPFYTGSPGFDPAATTNSPGGLVPYDPGIADRLTAAREGLASAAATLGQPPPAPIETPPPKAEDFTTAYAPQLPPPNPATAPNNPSGFFDAAGNWIVKTASDFADTMKQGVQTYSGVPGLIGDEAKRLGEAALTSGQQLLGLGGNNSGVEQTAAPTAAMPVSGGVSPPSWQQTGEENFFLPDPYKPNFDLAGPYTGSNAIDNTASGLDPGNYNDFAATDTPADQYAYDPLASGQYQDNYGGSIDDGTGPATNQDTGSQTTYEPVGSGQYRGGVVRHHYQDGGAPESDQENYPELQKALEEKRREKEALLSMTPLEPTNIESYPVNPMLQNMPGGNPAPAPAPASGLVPPQPTGAAATAAPSEKKPGFLSGLGDFLSQHSNVILPALTGLGNAAIAPTYSPLAAAVYGVGKGAEAYTGLQAQRADIAQTEAATTASRASTAQAMTEIANKALYTGPNGIQMIRLQDGSSMIAGQWLGTPAARRPMPLGGKEAADALNAVLGKSSSSKPVQLSRAPSVETEGQPPLNSNTPVNLATKTEAAFTPPFEFKPTILGTVGQQTVNNDYNRMVTSGATDAQRKISDQIEAITEVNASASQQQAINLNKLATSLASMPDTGRMSTGPLLDIQKSLLARFNNIADILNVDPRLKLNTEDIGNAGAATKISQMLSIAAANGADLNQLGALKIAEKTIPNTSMTREEIAKTLSSLYANQQYALESKKYLDESKAYLANTHPGQGTLYLAQNLMNAFTKDVGPSRYSQDETSLEKAFLAKITKSDGTSIPVIQSLLEGSISPDAFEKAYGPGSSNYFLNK